MLWESTKHFSTMKKYLFVVCLSLFSQGMLFAPDAIAQPKSIPVGTDLFIAKAEGKIGYYVSCRAGSTTCLWQLDVAFVAFGDLGHSAPITGPPYFTHPFYIAGDSIFYSPLDTGYLSPYDTVANRNDSLYIKYWGYGGFDKCDWECTHSDPSRIYRLNLHSYFDESVRVNFYHQTQYTFRYDTNTKKYMPIENKYFSFFNNTSSDVKYEVVKLDVDLDSKIVSKFTADTSSVSTLHSKFINCNYVSTRALHNAADSFQGKILFHVIGKSLDTILSLPISFIFEGIPAEGIVHLAKNNNTLSIKKNPTNERLFLLCNVAIRGQSMIQIFDELGRAVQTLHNGNLDAGEHEFSAKLLPGMYYVRMQAGDEVITRKVVVVK